MYLTIQKIEELDSITNSDVAKIKAFKIAPTGLVQVSEAMCFIFARKPSYANFLKLINETNEFFVDELIKPYNIASTSDYVLSSLESYVQNSDFNPENISLVSGTGGLLCKWILIVYQYAKLTSDVIDVELLIILFS